MLRSLALMFALLASPAFAQDAMKPELESAPVPARLSKLPEVLALTATKEGDWDDLGDFIGEALQEVEDLANKRGFKLTTTEVVIYEMFGLKNFRARIGYLIDPEGKVKPHRPAQRFDLRLLKGPAYMASDVGGAKAAPAVRQRVFAEIEKPKVKRLQGVEAIEFYYGDMDNEKTRVEVYGPLATKR